MAPVMDVKATPRTGGDNRVVNLTDSLPTSKKKNKQRSVGEVVCESDEDDVCAVGPIVVLKKKCDMRRYEKSEECFILDFDPFDVPVADGAKKIDEDVAVISEKGQVACRDYPHSRHLCLKFPFDKTPRESYCKLCYCYVCDTAAPCKHWKLSGHCHASDHIFAWKQMRELTKKTAMLNPI